MSQGLKILRNSVLALAALLCLASAPAFARGMEGPAAVDSLPREARETYRLILSGGPFPYAKDGAVFGNYQGMLPPQRRGYYREYTVRTPGARNRGARRIICGGSVEQWRGNRPAICYYTGDHYVSFRQIVN